MKKLFLLFILHLFSILFLYANNSDVKQLISQGNNVFVKVVDTNNDIDDEHNIFIKMLNSDEWNRWNLVDKNEDADFVCTLILKKKGAGFSMSDGKRVDAYLVISSVDGDEVWKSDKYTGNANMFTGFNSLTDAMRKIVRRALTDELYDKIIDRK